MNLAYILTRILLSLFALLPLPLASALGGCLMQLIGPLTKRHTIARKNLALIFPDKPANWHAQTLAGMWNHMGRVLAELPALKSGKLLSSKRRLGSSESMQSNPEMSAYPEITVVGAEHIKPNSQAIYVSAHLGQWEMLVPVAKALGVRQITALYRHINNARLDELLLSYRRPAHDKLIRKKGDNAFALVKALKSGDNLALLIDQRLAKGEPWPFLGIPAPTNMAAIKLSIKTGVPIVPAFVLREHKTTFKGHVCEPIYPPDQGSEEQKTQIMAKQLFDTFEQYIRAYPQQYMWTHNRWK